MSEPVTLRQKLMPVAIYYGIMLAVFLAFVPFMVARYHHLRQGLAKSETSSRYKWILLAMHNYQACHDHFPPQAICSPEGKPPLSWRVAILPYIEEEKLYQEFRLDEPWDSPHNLALLPRMPRTFKRPEWDRDGEQHTETPYRVVTGRNLIFDPVPQRRRAWADFEKELRHSLVLVETTETVPWTKPEDLDADDGQPLLPRLDRRYGKYVVGFADSSLLGLDLATTEEEFRATLNRLPEKR
jgi:hypothetical protein